MYQVFDVKHEFGSFRSLEEEVPVGIKHTAPKSGRNNRPRKSFWRELEAMRRLRSPHTVNVYGAITSRTDRYILVMELLPGGDLRALLKKAEEPLADEHARSIVRDICAGMAFLHRKEMVHGDMKSANVLFDAEGRAKVRSNMCFFNTMIAGLVVRCTFRCRSEMHRINPLNVVV